MALIRHTLPQPNKWAGSSNIFCPTPLIGQAATVVRPGGVVAIEIQYDQGQAVQGMFRAAGFESVGVRNDFEGHERVVLGQRPA